jgi:hypothetical protein
MGPKEYANGKIIGVVVNASENPVLEAAVMISGASPDHNDIAAVTLSDGFFQFNELQKGRYTITVNAEGFHVLSKQIIVTEGQVSKMKIKLLKIV